MSELAKLTVSVPKRLQERGLTTIEYAIGLLGAATAAILLLRIFSGNEMFDHMFKWVVDIFGKVAGGM